MSRIRIRRNNARTNAIISFINQSTILALGLIIPRLVLVSYGSETNGLVNTVTQIFTYVALLEAGIGNAAVNALYRPIVDNDQNAVSNVFAAAKCYFRRVTRIYAVCVLLLTFGYPFFVSSELGYFTVAWVVFLQGMSGVVTFYFVAAYKQLLIADGKYFIVSTIGLVIYVLSSVGKILLMNNGCDIVALQGMTFGVNCLQVIIFRCVIKRKYSFLQEVANPDLSALSERNAFIVHEVSGTIFSSTDVVLLSIFGNLKLTSVYSIYNMVFHSLSNLITTVNNSLDYILGHTYARGDKTAYIKVHDMYESIYGALTFALFTVAYVLILPFVSLYTTGISDIPYVDAYLPILFAIVQLLYCSKVVESRLITIAGHAHATQKRSVIEAGLNLGTSIILVNVIGIYGVLCGKIIALFYRSNDVILYANHKVLGRSAFVTYKKIIVNMLVFASIGVCEYFLRDTLMAGCSNYIWFVLYCLVITPFCIVAYVLAALITEGNLRLIIKQKLFGKK